MDRSGRKGNRGRGRRFRKLSAVVTRATCALHPTPPCRTLGGFPVCELHACDVISSTRMCEFFQFIKYTDGIEKTFNIPTLHSQIHVLLRRSFGI